MVQSYDNPGGKGARYPFVFMTTSAGFTGNMYSIIDGNPASNNTYFTGGTQTERHITFDFRNPRVVDEAKWYQSTAAAHGTWQWQGSNDGEAFVNIGGTFVLGGINIQTHTTLNGNTTPYRIYRMQQITGSTSSNPYLHEIEFRIDEEDWPTSYYNPGGSGDRTSAFTVTSFNHGGGNAQNLVNGAFDNAFWLKYGGVGTYITFDLKAPLIIDEAFLESSNPSTHGNWQWEGSNDGVSYTPIGDPFLFGGNRQFHETLHGNTTAYQYYRLRQIDGGTNGGPYLQEIWFRISKFAGDANSIVTQAAVLMLGYVANETLLTQALALVLGSNIPPNEITQALALILAVAPIVRELPVIPRFPETPIREYLAWQTDIFTSDNGTEQRIALRSTPRRRFTHNYAFASKRDISEFIGEVVADYGPSLGVPLYQYAVRLTDFVSVSDTVLKFDPNKSDVRAGSKLYISDQSFSEVVTVETVTEDGCTLAGPTLYPHRPGSLIAVLAECALSGPPAWSRRPRDESGTVEIASREIAAPGAFLRPGIVGSLTYFAGLPVLERNATGDEFQDSGDTGARMLDYGTSGLEVRAPWLHSHVQGQRQFLIQRHFYKYEMDYWRIFLDYAKGAANPFYWRTYRDDFEVIEPASTGETALKVAGREYGRKFHQYAPFQQIAVVSHIGVHYTRIVFVESDGGNSILHLETPLPSGGDWTAGQRAEMLVRMRLGSDEIELEHHPLHTFLTLDFRTVDA